MDHILTSAVLEQSHSAADYLGWVKSLIAHTKNEDLDGLRKVRLRIGLAKKLMEEALPIGRFAANYFGGSNQVNIALRVGSQGYDAVVSDFRNPPSGLKYLEVTLASEGESDYLRMLSLHEKGQVSGLGRVLKTGSLNSRLTVKVEHELISQSDVLAKERKIVSEAIERKLAKSYPANTALIIGFDDTMSFDRSDNIANIHDTLAEFGERLSVFHTVAVVGMVNNLFLVGRDGAA